MADPKVVPDGKTGAPYGAGGALEGAAGGGAGGDGRLGIVGRAYTCIRSCDGCGCGPETDGSRETYPGGATGKPAMSEAEVGEYVALRSTFESGSSSVRDTTNGTAGIVEV